jgi:hypothetical protein
MLDCDWSSDVCSSDLDVEKTGGVSFDEFKLVAPYALRNMMRSVTPPPGAVLPSDYISGWQKQINPDSPGFVTGQLARFLEKNLKDSGLNVGSKSAAQFAAAVTTQLLDGNRDGVVGEAELKQLAVEADELFFAPLK